LPPGKPGGDPHCRPQHAPTPVPAVSGTGGLKTSCHRSAARRPSGCRLPGQETTHRHHQSQARCIKSRISQILRGLVRA
jgi:hypothetical protein